MICKTPRCHCPPASPTFTRPSALAHACLPLLLTLPGVPPPVPRVSFQSLLARAFLGSLPSVFPIMLQERPDLPLPLHCCGRVDLLLFLLFFKNCVWDLALIRLSCSSLCEFRVLSCRRMFLFSGSLMLCLRGTGLALPPELRPPALSGPTLLLPCLLSRAGEGASPQKEPCRGGAPRAALALVSREPGPPPRGHGPPSVSPPPSQWPSGLPRNNCGSMFPPLRLRGAVLAAATSSSTCSVGTSSPSVGAKLPISFYFAV